MDSSGSYLNIFLVILAVAGGLLLVNGLIDVGFVAVRNRLEWLVRLPVRSRQKAKAASLPHR